MPIVLLDFRHNLSNGVAAAGYVALAIFAFEAQQSGLKIGALGLVTVASLLAWLLAFRRYHAIVDTPTARISSAPQGYVELIGHCGLLPGAPPLGFANCPPCVWYRYRVFRDGKQIDSGQSHDTFLLLDGSDECVIDPDLAEVVASSRRTTRRDNYTTHTDYLRVDAPLYAIGEFRTLTGTELTLDRRGAIRELLGDWKQDSNRLLERFDSNSDGEISLTEWQAVRQEAALEIADRHAEIRLSPDTHLLRAPGDGRPFILSGSDPDKLAVRYKLWAWLHAAVFIAAFAAALTMVARS
jgi:hypothetical protein